MLLLSILYSKIFFKMYLGLFYILNLDENLLNSNRLHCFIIHLTKTTKIQKQCVEKPKTTNDLVACRTTLSSNNLEVIIFFMSVHHIIYIVYSVLCSADSVHRRLFMLSSLKVLASAFQSG